MRLNKKDFDAKVKATIKSGEFGALVAYLICDDCKGQVDFCLICQTDLSKEHTQAFCGDASTQREPQHVCESCAERMGLFDEDADE